MQHVQNIPAPVTHSKLHNIEYDRIMNILVSKNRRALSEKRGPVVLYEYNNNKNDYSIIKSDNLQYSAVPLGIGRLIIIGRRF